MDISFLPYEICYALNKVNLDLVYEIRLRKEQKITLSYNNLRFYLGKNGLSNDYVNAITCSQKIINEIIDKVTERSIYAFNDRIKDGFLTTNCGVRIGLGGECVFNDGQIITIKEINSLNIRIPHDIKDCSKLIFDTTLANLMQNVLIISPPGKGKTTILKDLCYKLNDMKNKSILIIDERGEFNHVCGECIDKISFADKLYAFSYGIRSLSPNIIITDELSSSLDYEYAYKAVNSGVNIIATAHGACAQDVINKFDVTKNIFDVYVELSKTDKPGVINKILYKEQNQN